MTWQRLSPRMLLVHPIYELARELPFLIGAIVVGTTTGNQWWAFGVLGYTLVVGVARWVTTSYRINASQLQLRTGLLQRKVLSLPLNRIRSVSSDARLLHRVMGLAVVRVSTGQQAKGESGSGVFELNAVEVGQVPRLKAILLADTTAPAEESAAAVPSDVLARWQPAWLRYSPLSVSGLLTLAAAAGLVYQYGFVGPLQHSRIVTSVLDEVQRLGTTRTVEIVAGAILVASVVLAVVRSLLTWGNLVLLRQSDVLHLRHGLLRLRERAYDMSRLRGGTLRQPLLVRMFGGARLDAVMTGVHGAGEASVLLPPCPAATAEAVLAELVGDPEVVTGPLRGHGRRAALRRWTRGLGLSVLVGVGLAAALMIGGKNTVPVWVWPAWIAVTAWCALLAVDRIGALGHRVHDGWLVMRSGSVERRRDCLATAGIISWTVRQTPFQRRAKVATLVAATAAGVKRYPLIDVPDDVAWSIAAEASPWVAESIWARS
ncbi:PH domain-containing protein [Candidatus Mycobacterium wuenschmannii]|uniref:PH domain-containing protein n=1 Tax=Candidatus Mycobacterium wuenschmannii TaxID=3027808 RepID=A0ABY8VWT5_9MYCO|nr:PH domain-containing protein [Candidatus Mycobacterium wuenschmannii]WIM87254.1 PH domain-containing protein [Candidatus Mycobacterium wuenschmannii]